MVGDTILWSRQKTAESSSELFIPEMRLVNGSL